MRGDEEEVDGGGGGRRGTLGADWLGLRKSASRKGNLRRVVEEDM